MESPLIRSASERLIQQQSSPTARDVGTSLGFRSRLWRALNPKNWFSRQSSTHPTIKTDWTLESHRATNPFPANRVAVLPDRMSPLLLDSSTSSGSNLDRGSFDSDESRSEFILPEATPLPISSNTSLPHIQSEVTKQWNLSEPMSETTNSIHFGFDWLRDLARMHSFSITLPGGTLIESTGFEAGADPIKEGLIAIVRQMDGEYKAQEFSEALHHVLGDKLFKDEAGSASKESPLAEMFRTVLSHTKALKVFKLMFQSFRGPVLSDLAPGFMMSGLQLSNVNSFEAPELISLHKNFQINLINDDSVSITFRSLFSLSQTENMEHGRVCNFDTFTTFKLDVSDAYKDIEVQSGPMIDSIDTSILSIHPTIFREACLNPAIPGMNDSLTQRLIHDAKDHFVTDSCSLAGRSQRSALRRQLVMLHKSHAPNYEKNVELFLGLGTLPTDSERAARFVENFKGAANRGKSWRRAPLRPIFEALDRYQAALPQGGLTSPDAVPMALMTLRDTVQRFLADRKGNAVDRDYAKYLLQQIEYQKLPRPSDLQVREI